MRRSKELARIKAASEHKRDAELNYRQQHPLIRHSDRFLLFMAGLVFASVGVFKIQRGVLLSKHWTGQPMFSWGLFVAGGLCLLFAFIPTSWLWSALTPRAEDGKIVRK